MFRGTTFVASEDEFLSKQNLKNVGVQRGLRDSFNVISSSLYMTASSLYILVRMKAKQYTALYKQCVLRVSSDGSKGKLRFYYFMTMIHYRIHIQPLEKEGVLFCFFLHWVLLHGPA